MGVISLIFHPNQLKAVLQWKLWHEPLHKRDPEKEAPTLKSCFAFLHQTSRSFAAVIQELHPELLVPICLFYLVLRGLDTIEDDQTLDIKEKVALLRRFHENMVKDGWTYEGSGPDEKDRELLVHFDDVVTELKKIPEKYLDIINEITIKMGNGMADYALNAEQNVNGVETVADYEKYCHYVAGLVGEGLTRLFITAELANPKLLGRPSLTESMGQFLQKTNIIRDIREDWDDKRRWWPREIWSKYFEEWDDIFLPERRDVAVECLSEMILNALKHCEDCIFYMAGVKDQSVFNFVAIPQSMAIATLELMFRNPAVFDGNVKITKGDACQLMIDSTQDLLSVCDVFRKYLRKIHEKNDPRDRNYLAISLRCAKIEQFIETIYPRQDPKRMKRDYNAKVNKDPTMDVGDGVVLVLVVMMAFAFVVVVMIGAAYFSNLYFQKYYNDEFPAGPGHAGGTPMLKDQYKLKDEL